VVKPKLTTMLRKSIITTSAIALLAIGAWAISDKDHGAQSSTSCLNIESSTSPHKHTPEQQARIERRAARLAEYERHIDSLITSHNFRFIPQTMQQLPAGMMRNLNSAMYEVTVGSQAVDVCIPYLKGYVPPYYPVIFNYVLPSVMGYNAEKSNNGWHITFKTTMFSATEYTFLFEISPHYGDAMLTISSPYYNSVQYTGNIVGI
jgi:hypothetical protein